MNAPGGSFLKTKVVCTIGPASSDPATLEAMLKAGMDVARLNMSHSSAEQTRTAACQIRDCSERLGRPVALLVDLQGPKIRVGELANPLSLSPGERVVLTAEGSAAAGEIPVTYAGLAADLAAGDRVLMHDGRIEIRVLGVSPPRVEAEVVVGGELKTGRGLNLPGVRVNAPALTDKDRADVELARELEAEYLALSFVRSADNLRELRGLVSADTLVLAKIEKDVALQELEQILESSDAVMVARGDLGTELPFEQVPLVQKRIVRRANARYRPVIIATEMLESMVERPRPTRAEVSDVANAILDGTDAVMLSAETAIGRHPVEAVRALTRVIGEVESKSAILDSGPPYDVPEVAEVGEPSSTELAVARATLEAVRAINAPAIVTHTRSGFTARVISSRRPPVPVLAVTDTEHVLRQLSMVWGVLPALCPAEPSDEAMWETARAELLRRGLAAVGDRVVVTAGVPFHVRGTTNMIRIQTL
ncbi:MAG: pyruvate kinase [Gemmatimonadetes bacterium]|nr:pyruvate kinase [Gemmatimonadota bacterium]NIO32075.1 pyruvate kinase [Gemmatimonadota bacterium]